MTLTKQQQNNILILEHFYKYEWWKSSSSGRRCLFPPLTIPRSFAESSFKEWFLERANGTEDLVGDFNIKDYPDFYTDYNHAFNLLDKIRTKLKTGFVLCDFNWDKCKYQLDLVDSNFSSIFDSITECIVDLALQIINNERSN